METIETDRFDHDPASDLLRLRQAARPSPRTHARPEAYPCPDHRQARRMAAAPRLPSGGTLPDRRVVSVHPEDRGHQRLARRYGSRSRPARQARARTGALFACRGGRNARPSPGYRGVRGATRICTPTDRPPDTAARHRFERLAADVEGRLTGEIGRPIRRLPTRCPARAGRSDGLLLKTASSFRRAPEQFLLLFKWLLCKQAPLFDK